MKLLRCGEAGRERPALLDPGHGLRGLSSHAPDIAGATLWPEAQVLLRSIDPESLPPVPPGHSRTSASPTAIKTGNVCRKGSGVAKDLSPYTMLQSLRGCRRWGAGAMKISLLYGNPSATFTSEFLVDRLENSYRIGCQSVIEKRVGLYAYRIRYAQYTGLFAFGC